MKPSNRGLHNRVYKGYGCPQATDSKKPYKTKIIRLLLTMGYHEQNLVSLTRLRLFLRNHGLNRRQSVYSALKQLDEIGFLKFHRTQDRKTFVGYYRDYPMLDSIRKLYAPNKNVNGSVPQTTEPKQPTVSRNTEKLLVWVAGEGDARSRREPLAEPLSSNRQSHDMGSCSPDRTNPKAKEQLWSSNMTPNKEQ